jgi:hypothetical protein
MTYIFFAEEFHRVKVPTKLYLALLCMKRWGDFHPSERFRAQRLYQEGILCKNIARPVLLQALLLHPSNFVGNFWGSFHPPARFPADRLDEWFRAELPELFDELCVSLARPMLLGGILPRLRARTDSH